MALKAPRGPLVFL